MKCIGITGGIGSGKSVVSSLLKIMGYPVYDCDEEARKIMYSSVVRDSLLKIFGTCIFREGELDRQALATKVFSNDELLFRLNAIVHPAVKEDFLRWTYKQNSSLLFMESAILYESGFDSEVDDVWLVTAPQELRINRVMSRNGLSREDVVRRMNSQMPEEEKCRRAHITIVNDGETALIPRIEYLISRY